MKFRHECKHIILLSDMISLRQRLNTVMAPDIHAVNGFYKIRSLYFDNLYDKALNEKLNGVNCREKFRLRYYDRNSKQIKLEKKSKINGLCSKESVWLTKEEAQRIADLDTDWMTCDNRPLVTELYSKMQSQGLRPRTIVDYMREPFVYPVGDVRVTLDYDIRTGTDCCNFLSDNCIMIPTDGKIILEVKWDEFLPNVIRDIIQLNDTRTGAFSKYAACRIYG